MDFKETDVQLAATLIDFIVRNRPVRALVLLCFLLCLWGGGTSQSLLLPDDLHVFQATLDQVAGMKVN